MRRLYVASIRFGLPLIHAKHRKQSNHARLYLLSSETCAKRSVGVRLLFASILPALPNLWLIICVPSHLATLCCLMVLDMAASTDCNDNDDDDDDDDDWHFLSSRYQLTKPLEHVKVSEKVWMHNQIHSSHLKTFNSRQLDFFIYCHKRPQDVCKFLFKVTKDKK